MRNYFAILHKDIANNNLQKNARGEKYYGILVDKFTDCPFPWKMENVSRERESRRTTDEHLSLVILIRKLVIKRRGIPGIAENKLPIVKFYFLTRLGINFPQLAFRLS